MGKCTKCGFEMEDGARFCAQCGQASGGVRLTNAPGKMKKQDKTVLIVLAVGILIVLIVTQSIYLLFKRKMESFAVNFFQGSNIEEVKKGASLKYAEMMKRFEENLIVFKEEADTLEEFLPQELKGKVFSTDAEASAEFKRKIDELSSAPGKRTEEENRRLEAYNANLKYYSLKINMDAISKMAEGMKEITDNLSDSFPYSQDSNW